ncbi:type II secretion system protein GspM [Acidovorax sp.]|jgi:general secretion pathway protein M|uniref:type II secretion system protein GspM n=1 Tax=Acidovorax sp. TaxID=1872122 RepID=UPI00391FB8F7
MSRLAPLKAQWQGMAPREQNFVLAASALVGLALVWWVAISPALQTLRAAPKRHAELDTQLQRMRSLQAEAQQLQAMPRNSAGDATGALRNGLTQRMGTAAQLNVVGDRATVILKAAPADAIAQWLALARSNARAVPVEARLTRSATPAAPVAAAGNARPGPQGPAAAPALPAPGAGAAPSGPLMPPIPGAMPAAGSPPALGNAPTGSTSGTPRWDGTLVLALPAR